MKKQKKTKKKKQDKNLIDFLKKNKVLVFLVVSLLVIIFFSFGTKIYLWVNFLLGNDIIVKLNVDKEFLSLVHNQEENIKFEVSVTTNPFCRASCKSTFTDISTGKITEQDQFTLKPTVKLYKDFTIKASKPGAGLELYRFSLECGSKKTLLCHTDEEATARNILITVKYDLNEEDKKLKNALKEDLKSLAERLGELKGVKSTFQDVINTINKTIIIDNLNKQIENIEKNIKTLIERIQETEDIWKKQDYALLASEVSKLNKNIAETENSFPELNKSTLTIIRPYNVLIDELAKAKEQLEQISTLAIIKKTKASEINNTILEFNSVIKQFKQKHELEKKKIIVADITERTQDISSSTENELKKETLKRELELDSVYDALCQITGSCNLHPPIEERANQDIFDLKKACTDIDRLKEELLLLNTSIRASYIKEDYPDNENFRKNISLKLKNIKQNITNDYLKKLPEEANTKIIKELLVEQTLFETENYPQHNLSPILTAELLKQFPDSCYSSDSKINSIDEFDIDEIKINKSLPMPVNIALEEPQPQCCVFNECYACCITEKCSNENYPIVFLHGHSLNKDTSAEYSLDAFNKIQEKLENDGYLNAGAISLYTERDTPYGIWGMPKVPLTIKASYYFDLFREPENYLVVQTKSENMDTYAIRLKELIETIQYKTGKKKVIIIAHSMGGLVGRRYLQIFGSEKVEKLILIATPNKGIIGNVADYCTIIGEKLECRDMNANSLFMNKLNREKLPNIPIYNVVGTGCEMDKKTGDGIVLEKNSMLDGAKNFIINGTCRRLEPLHTELLNIVKYPETYFVIKESLEE